MALTGSDRAYLYAQSGSMRSGTSRSNVTTPKVFIAIDGVHYATARATSAQRAMHESLSITDGTPSTCSFKVKGFVPTAGQEVIITLGSKNTLHREFAGVILTPVTGYVGTPANSETNIAATDYSWHLTRTKITKRYTNQSATDIAIDIVSNVNGFTSNNVEAGLATVDEITFTNTDVMSALNQLAKRIGGYVKVDYIKDVHLGVTDTSETAPTSLTSSHASLDAFTVSRDISQVVNRVYVEGGGTNALGTALAADTRLAVQDVAWYNSGGGTVVCGPQRITYTGTDTGGGGTLVGTGATPSAAPAVVATSGAGLGAGVYTYAYTDVTAAGESLPSPLATVTTSTNTGPASGPSIADSISDGSQHLGSAGDTISYTYSYSSAASATDMTAETSQSAASSKTLTTYPDLAGAVWGIVVTVTHSTDAAMKWIHVFRSLNAGTYHQITQTALANNSSGGTSQIRDWDVVTTTLVPSASAHQNVAVSSIAIGATGTTSRKVYRTVVAGSQLKLLTTLADNTTTTYADSTADGSLGANAPVTDTSGLTQPSGQVAAGSTTLLVAGAGAFHSTGGLALIGGQQLIRYTGTTGNTLTGIPATGTGAITATVAYNSTVTSAPCLTGIPASGTGAIVYNIRQGDAVNLLVQVDDVFSQSVLADTLGGTDDGIIEEYIQDGRISETEALARGAAVLELRSTQEEHLSWQSRDRNTRAGRDIVVSVTDPTTVSDTFKVQQVTISNFQTAIFPTFSASASATRFSLEDLLRQARKGQA